MLPRVILYNAVSVDGRTEGFAPDLGQFYGLVAHWKEDATLAGSNTVLAAPGEIPEEDEKGVEAPARDPADPRPLLVIPDSRGQVRFWHYLRSQPYWRDAVALCSRRTSAGYLEYLKQTRIEYIISGDDRVDLRRALEELAERYSVKVIRVDSGGTLNGALLRAGLVSEVSILISPCLVGCLSTSSILRAAGPDVSAPGDGVIDLRLQHVQQLEGGAVWLRYEVKNHPSLAG